MIKFVSMTKKEIKSMINKAAYKYAESLGYEVHDDNDGSYVTFIKLGKLVDDSIDWHRSQHETCVLNWAGDDTKSDAEKIDRYMSNIIATYNNLYSK